MTCQELVELVTDYLEGALSREDAARFDAHVAACPGCETYVAQVQATIAVSRASAAQVEPGEIAPLLDAFRDWRRGQAT